MRLIQIRESDADRFLNFEIRHQSFNGILTLIPSMDWNNRPEFLKKLLGGQKPGLLNGSKGANHVFRRTAKQSTQTI